MQYTVRAMIQHADNEPVPLVYYRGDSFPRALAAMTTASVAYLDDDEASRVFKMRTVSVTLEFDHGEDEEQVPGCSCGMADLGAPGHDHEPERWFIRNHVSVDPFWWSDSEQGWVGSMDYATLYTKEETRRWELPIEGEWVKA